MSVIVEPAIQLASLGIPDTLFLMLLALVVFGPRRLPEIGRQIGKLMYEFRKVSNDFRFQMEEELRASEEADRQKKLQASLPPPTPPVLSDASMIHESVPAPVPELAAPTYETSPAPSLESDPEALPVAAPTLSESAPLESTPPNSIAAPVVVENPVSFAESITDNDAASAELRNGAAHPPQPIRIQPPLTGETVAAARPFRAVLAQTSPENLDAGANATADAGQPVASPSPSQEPEAHHA